MSSPQVAVAPAPSPRVIPAREICTRAAAVCGVPVESVTLALGAISNLYCMYAYEHPDLKSTVMRGFLSPPIASREAALRSIQFAAPSLRRTAAVGVLTALSVALDQLVGESPVRIVGFGMLLRIDDGYELTLELPLTDYLRRTAFQ